MSVPSIGVIGNGFVGGALIKGFSTYTAIQVYDKEPMRSLNSLESTCESDILFVAVPTPMYNLGTGQCDTRILEDALDNINLACASRKLVVVRSTLPPGYFRKNHTRWHKLEIVYMPEFLTERTADLDFIQSRRFIFGISLPGVEMGHKPVIDLFKFRFPSTKMKVMTWEGASLVKYGTNVFFTTKLSFFNELAKVAEALGEDGQDIINEVVNDGRIGLSHFQVPGHDGDRGWGGHCFPKDNRAFSAFGHDLGVECYMADAAWLTNEAVRTKRDWEDMKGRAVSDDE